MFAFNAVKLADSMISIGSDSDDDDDDDDADEKEHKEFADCFGDVKAKL